MPGLLGSLDVHSWVLAAPWHPSVAAHQSLVPVAWPSEVLPGEMPGREKPLRAPHTLILCPGQHGSGNEEEPHAGSIRHVALQRQGPQSLMSAVAVGPPPTALWVLPASSLLGAPGALALLCLCPAPAPPLGRPRPWEGCVWRCGSAGSIRALEGDVWKWLLWAK